ncbi:MAG: glycosyltransferase family 4 protein [Planctomycetes bacterium]|nr:glycosyltransferase family 4 protein [Planctomycetota bacterium]
MRIALVSEWLDAWRGGAETSTLQFLHHLMDSGTEVHVYTRSRPSPTPDLTVHTISGASMSRTRRSVTFAHRVERRLRAESFDVVHAISPCRGVDIYQPRGGTVAETIQRNIALRQSPAGRSIKQYTNYFNLKQRFMLRMERQLMLDPRGPIVVAISDYVVNQLKSHYDLPDHRVRKIFNGVNIPPSSKAEVAEQRRAIRLEFGVKNDQLLVLTVAHNFRLKGVARWLEALALLRSRGVTDVRAIVLGKGDSPRWHRLVQRLDLAEWVTFVGPSDRVQGFYRAADCLVHPTYYDPCSRVVMEAMTSGLPCVTSKWDGASELVEDGVNGYRMEDPWDIAALADRVDRLRDKPHAQALGLAAREVGTRISMAEHTKKMLDLYSTISTDGKHE